MREKVDAAIRGGRMRVAHPLPHPPVAARRVPPSPASGRGAEGRRHAIPLRSFLFAPGNHPRRVEKALTLDADAVILDLEDAVAIAEKIATRNTAVAA